MKIGIDASRAAQERVVGISRFVVNLARSLAELDADNEYVLCYRPKALLRPQLLWRPRDPRFRVRVLIGPLLRTLDVYHGTYQWLPQYLGHTPVLGTLHDIFYLSQPDMGTKRTRLRWQARYRDVAARSRLIMTLSEFSKAEIVNHLGVEPARVRVVPLAADPAYVPQDEATVASVRQRYGLDRPYILFGGGFGRRKNIIGALRAFAEARPRLPAEVYLAVSGGGGPHEAQARFIVQQHNLGQWVKWLGFVPDADHPGLMTGCMLYFFPSLLEGFGLPALEAMACGAAVITSSTTSLPEVCGDAAVLIDPTDAKQMAGALVEVARDTDQRVRLRQRGLERTALFSWRHVASTVLELYRDVAGTQVR